MSIFAKMEVCYLWHNMSLQSWMVIRFVLERCHHKHISQSFHHTPLVFCTWLTLLFQLSKSCLSFVLSITFPFLHKSGSIHWFLIVQHHLFLWLENAMDLIMNVSKTKNRIWWSQRGNTVALPCPA